PQMLASGGALFDFDNDGRLDAYLVQHGGPQSRSTNRLFHQEANGTFRDVSSGSGVDVRGWGMGTAVGDVNNDGWPDLLLTEYGRIRLFVNNRNGTFTDMSAQAGIEDAGWATSACFFDYDRDGWLDLFVANYVENKPQTVCNDRAGKRDFCGPSSFPGSASRLFHNGGVRRGSRLNAPAFTDVTARSGIGSTKGPALGALCADLTGDRWPDVLVANDGAANFLWVNRHDGTFAEEAVQRGIAYDAMGRAQANMGIAFGDLNGDGLMDLFITHLPSELHIGWLQGPAGFFQDRTSAIGLAGARWHSTGFGTSFADFDQDGALDLAVVNGAVKRLDTVAPGLNRNDYWSWYAERNQLFANDGTGRFRDVSLDNPVFSSPPGVSRGLAVGDVDGDGALDVLVTRTASSARLFKNVAPDRGHWLKIRAIEPAHGGRDAYGAQVTVRAGQRRWTRVIAAGTSFLSSGPAEAHVGLGTVDRVDAVDIVWPDGTEQHFPGSPADRAIVLRKDGGR
ncbi:MAG TPA: CRTAC1 family protein, partial [Vicinamibacterales bacterium]|nr:CRTAC1 family protein [Vicinamibacterales bacterium]